MSAQGLEVLDHTVQLTHEWIGELRDRLGWTSSRDALRLMRVVLVELRDRIPHDEAAQFAAQLPLLVRGMFYEGWRPSQTPISDHNAELFLRAVAEKMDQVPDWRGDADIAAVFATLAGRISEGELRHVRHALPRAIRGLWPAEMIWSDD